MVSVRCSAFDACGEKIRAPRRAFLHHLVDVSLLELLDSADDLVKVWPVAGTEFGVKELAIGADFKCAAARGNERKRFDALAEFENLGRQTDGLRRVVSNHAIFDRYLAFHLALLSGGKGTDANKNGQAV